MAHWRLVERRRSLIWRSETGGRGPGRAWTPGTCGRVYAALQRRRRSGLRRWSPLSDGTSPIDGGCLDSVMVSVVGVGGRGV